MNNRKRQVQSLLDGLTLKEIEDYLEDNKINKDKLNSLELLKKYKEYKGDTSHRQKLANQVFNNIEDIYLLGQANIISAILYYGLHKDFNVKDFVKVYDEMLKEDSKLKEFVYESMKDYD